MGVRIQELPETTGIKKEDVLIVEDGQGTKKGTVQQLDEALGVSQLKEDLVSEENRAIDVEKTKINKPTSADNNKFPRAKDGDVEWVEHGLPTDEQTASAVSDWLNVHPEATTTVQAGSLTEDKFTDDLKLYTLKDYVTPEMFGAVGDGVTDDINAIQRTIDYALQNKKSVKFTKDYIISRSLVVSSGNEHSNYGSFIDGNNKKLIISTDNPAVIVIGSDNTIKDLTITYTSNLYMKYSSSFIQLRATPETIYGLCRNRFENITIRCSEEWREHVLYESVAFEFVLHGTSDSRAYAYDNRFVACMCRNIGTCIKITENEYSNGCNGNDFDISGWAIDCYLNGKTGRCVFNGLVQPEELKTDGSENILNKYLFKNMGDYNLINCSIYDYNSSIGTIDRPLIVDKSGIANNFNQSITPEGVEKNINNFYNFYSKTCGNIILPISPFVSNYRAPMLSYLPFHNSFNVIKEATMKIENVSLSNGFPQTNDKYTEISNGVYTNVAAIFHDDSTNRQLGFFKYTGSGNGLLTIEFVPKGIIDIMFIYFSHYSGVPSGVHLKLEYSNGTEIIYDMEQTLGNGGSIAHYMNYNGNRIDIPTKAQILVDINKESNMYIGQICGYMHDKFVGIV